MQNLMNETVMVKLLYSYGVLLAQLESHQLEMNSSMWSNEKDYFHFNFFPTWEECPVSEETLLSSSACTQTGGDDRDPHPSSRYERLYRVRADVHPDERLVSNSSINGKSTDQCTVLPSPGCPSTLQQTLFYRLPESDNAPFLALGLIFLGLSFITPELI